MAVQATCPQGHRFATVAGRPAICPECGAESTSLSSSEPLDPYRTLDSLPPPPVPLTASWYFTAEEKKSREAAARERASFHLGGYEILDELGRGGMGVVYKARQISLDRPVALKMILGGGTTFSEELARFRVEAEAFAQLRHPNIVQIYEIGEQDGRPYLALEFVEGGTLARHLSGTPIDPNLSAQVVETLAQAVQFAHARNIIHRDLKPANILLQFADDSEPIGSKDTVASLRLATPKITDFGLAKRLDHDTGQTRTGSIMGTPSYMAPEQAAGTSSSHEEYRIGPAADVYALGAILYEMLTGRPPFRGITPLQTLQQVLRDDPVPPRRLQPGVPLDLETICLKCLAKEPGRRYASAQALTEDLARFRAGKPILARPTGWPERTIKWIKRNRVKTALIGVSAVAALMFVGLGVAGYYNSLLKESLDETEKQRGLVRRYHYLAEMNLGQRFWREHQVPRLLDLLAAYPKADEADLRSFEWRYLWSLCHADLLTFAEHEQPVTCIAFSPTENLVASGSGKSTFTGAGIEGFGEVRLWDPESGKVGHVLKGHSREVNGLAFRPDGKLLATASSDKTVRVWNVASGKETCVLHGHTAEVTAVAFDPTGTRLASSSKDRSIILWNVQTEKPVRILEEQKEHVLCLAFNPDGTHLVFAGGDLKKNDPCKIWVWDLTSGKATASYPGHDGAVTALAFNPDRKSFASAGADRVIRVWDAARPNEGHVLRGHRDRVTCLAFDKSGRRLASGSLDLTAIVWNPGSGEALFSRQGHTDGIRGAAFSSDGTRLLSAANDRTVKVWNADGDQEFAALAGHSSQVTEVAFRPDGRLLASAGLDHSVRIWDTDRRTQRHVLTGHADAVQCLAFHPRGIEKERDWQLISGGDDGAIRFWDITAGKEVFCLNTPGQQIRALALNPVGTLLAYAGVDGQDFDRPAAITLWDTATKKTVRTLLGHSSRVSCLTFSLDGRRLVSANAGDRGNVKIWDVDTGNEAASIALENATEPRVVFSTDGKRLAIANGEITKGRIRIHDARSGRQELILDRHLGMASALAFTPDGERLVTTDGKLGAASRIKLWDVQTGQEVLTLRGPTGVVRSLAFSADGRRLACGGGPLLPPERGEIILWEAPLPP